jgi:hypothetical protein
VLNSLLNSARVLRLVEQQAVDGAAAYAPLDFLAHLRKGVWSEVYSTPAGVQPIDAYRRNLQRNYIDTLSARVNGAQAQSDDARAFFRGELKSLQDDLQGSLARVSDRATSLHIQDALTIIARALDPTAQPAAAGARSTTTAFDDVDLDSCWPDYVIARRKQN